MTDHTGERIIALQDCINSITDDWEDDADNSAMIEAHITAYVAELEEYRDDK